MAGAAPQEHTGKGGKKALDAELNLVPFIDLLSCCISFLLITAVCTQIAGIKVASSGGPPDPQAKQESTIDVRLLLNDKGYQLIMSGASLDIHKQNGGFDRKTPAEMLKTLKSSLPDQSAMPLQPA